MYINEEHKKIVEGRGYGYIGSYKYNEVTIDGKNNKDTTYIRIQCFYCKNEYDVRLSHFKRGDNCTKCCNRYENSFAYHIEKELNEPLDKFWDWNKNIVNPYYISKNYNKKVYIKCINTNYHGSYEITCNSFVRGRRCSYCYGKKVHPKDSFGALYPEKTKYWSKRNKKSPYEVAPQSHKKYYFYCENCGKEFETRLYTLINKNRSMKCLNCTCSRGEEKINKFLTEHNINFISQKEFDNLLGINNGNLSYDFYLPDYNLLIEFQGKQHEQFTKGFHITIEGFKKQQEHDKRKKQYAEDHNIDLLEIWYYDYNNVEEILQQTLYN